MMVRNTGTKNSVRRLTILALLASVGWVVGCGRVGAESQRSRYGVVESRLAAHAHGGAEARYYRHGFK